MKVAALVIPVFLLALSTSCFNAGSTTPNPNPTEQVLETTVYPAQAGTIKVDLMGPRTNTYGPVTYYFFGTDANYGDEANVPLQSERLGEVKFGPLATGEKMLDIDLSPWSGYNYIYMRTLEAKPNRAHAITPGHYYVFTTN